MERVKKSEKYWYVDSYGHVVPTFEVGFDVDNCLFQYGNYFHTKEEAEVMSCKLRAVLKGAEVIEMPEYDGEYFNAIEEIYERKGYSNGEYCHRQSFSWGFQEGAEWLESKIVK